MLPIVSKRKRLSPERLPSGAAACSPKGLGASQTLSAQALPVPRHLPCRGAPTPVQCSSQGLTVMATLSQAEHPPILPAATCHPDTGPQTTAQDLRLIRTTLSLPSAPQHQLSPWHTANLYSH